MFWPSGQSQVFPVSGTAAGVPSGKVLSQAVKPLPKTEWLEVQGKAQSSVGFDVECSVTIPPDAARGKVLLLVQFPHPFAPSQCTATVNGAKATLEEKSSSADKIGAACGVHYFDPKSYWAGAIPYATEWTWYICEVKPGESQVRFTGCAGREDARIGLWVWSDRDCADGQMQLSQTCTRPEMPQYQEWLDRAGICVIKPR